MSKALPQVSSPSSSSLPASAAKKGAASALPPLGDAAGRLTTDRPRSTIDKDIDTTLEKREGLNKKLAHWQPCGVYAEKKWAAVQKTMDVLEEEIRAQDELLTEYEKELVEIAVKAENPISPRAGEGPADHLGKRKSIAVAKKKDMDKSFSAKDSVRFPRDPELLETCKSIYYQTRGASVVEIVTVPVRNTGRSPFRKMAGKKKAASRADISTPEIIQTTSSLVGVDPNGAPGAPASNPSMIKKTSEGLSMQIPTTASSASSISPSSREQSQTRRSLASRGATPGGGGGKGGDEELSPGSGPAPAMTSRSQRPPTSPGAGAADVEFGSVYASNREMLSSAQSNRSRAEDDGSKPATPAVGGASRPTSPSFLAVDTGLLPGASSGILETPKTHTVSPRQPPPQQQLPPAPAVTQKQASAMITSKAITEPQVLTKGGIFCPPNMKEEIFQAIMALRTKRLEAEELKAQKQQTLDQLRKREETFQKMQDVTNYSVGAIDQDLALNDKLLAKQRAIQREEDMKYLASIGALGNDDKSPKSKTARKGKK